MIAVVVVALFHGLSCVRIDLTSARFSHDLIGRDGGDRTISSGSPMLPSLGLAEPSDSAALRRECFIERDEVGDDLRQVDFLNGLPPR